MKRSRERGVTLLSLLCALLIMGWILTLGVEGWSAWQERARMLRSRQLVVQAIHDLRLQARRRQCAFRLALVEGVPVGQRQMGQVWSEFQRLSLPEGIRVDLVGRPVFHPSGWVAPAGSIRLRGGHAFWGIFISSNGRVRQEALTP